MTIIYAIIIFCLLIFVHEFGHFIVAKACGVKVNEFAIGMGPALFKKQKGRPFMRSVCSRSAVTAPWKGKTRILRNRAR